MGRAGPSQVPPSLCFQLAESGTCACPSLWARVATAEYGSQGGVAPLTGTVCHPTGNFPVALMASLLLSTLMFHSLLFRSYWRAMLHFSEEESVVEY